MTPEFITFNGLKIPTQHVWGKYRDRKVSNCIDKSKWHRIILHKQNSVIIGNLCSEVVDNWMATHILGRWSLEEYTMENEIVICIEDSDDAIMFKLMDGLTVCGEIYNE